MQAQPTYLSDLTLDKLADYLQSIGQPRFRAK